MALWKCDVFVAAVKGQTENFKSIEHSSSTLCKKRCIPDLVLSKKKPTRGFSLLRNRHETPMPSKAFRDLSWRVGSTPSRSGPAKRVRRLSSTAPLTSSQPSALSRQSKASQTSRSSGSRCMAMCMAGSTTLRCGVRTTNESTRPSSSSRSSRTGGVRHRSGSS